MDPAFMFVHLDPANRFAMEGLNIEHIKHHHLGLSLTANIRENSAVIRMYDNYATVNSQLLHITISNLWDLENQLWQLYIEVNGVIHDFIPHLEDIPPLEDSPAKES